MIIFIDISNRLVSLHNENGVKTIPFKDYYTLKEYIRDDEKNYYVTNAIEVSSSEITELVYSLIEEGDSEINSEQIETSNVLYIHSLKNSPVVIPGIGLLRDLSDCKEIDEKLREIIDSSTIIRKMLANGSLEIIGQNKKKRVTYEYNEKKRKEEIAKAEKRDKEIDKIIVDRNNMTGIVDDDVITLDITEEVNRAGME